VRYHPSVAGPAANEAPRLFRFSPNSDMGLSKSKVILASRPLFGLYGLRVRRPFDAGFLGVVGLPHDS